MTRPGSETPRLEAAPPVTPGWRAVIGSSVEGHPIEVVTFGTGPDTALVLAGIILYLQDKDPGARHMFYGFLVLFTLAFAYMYRAPLAKRPALAWGLLMLFVMGLGLRAITTFEGS